MDPLFYIMKRSLINSVRELPKKPLALIAYVIMAIFFVLMLLLILFTPSGLLHRGSAEAFGALASLVVLALVYFGIRQGIASGSSFFRLADVNLVFTAPISPRRVLVYGFIQQFFLYLVVILFLTFQIPNLRNNFTMLPGGILVVYAGVLLLLFTMQLIGMLVYSLSSRSARIRSILEQALNLLAGLFVAGFIVVLLEKKDLLPAAVSYLNSPIIEYLPLIGWFKTMLMAAVGGTGPAFLTSLALVLASIALMILVLSTLKADYYEDVLAPTEYREQALKARREKDVTWGLKRTRVRKVAYEFTSTGAAAIWQRHLLEYKKTGWFFVDKYSLIMIACGIGAKYLFHGVSINTALYFTVYLLFFFSIQGKWAQELGRPFIYLVPASSASKVLYATLAEVLKNGVDGLLLFAAAGLMFRSDVATVCLCALVYMTFGAVFTYGDVLARKLFGQTHSRNLALFMKMFLILFIVAPGIVISVLIGFFSGFILGPVFGPVFKSAGLTAYISYLALIGYNVLACALMLTATRSVFEDLELG